MLTPSNHDMKIGEILPLNEGEIALNLYRLTQTVTVINTGDRPIQIGSHYHFYEVNDALTFNREPTRGYRLNIPSGTATRFEPGQSRQVQLVEVGGLKQIYGFAGRVMGLV